MPKNKTLTRLDMKAMVRGYNLTMLCIPSGIGLKGMNPEDEPALLTLIANMEGVRIGGKKWGILSDPVRFASAGEPPHKDHNYRRWGRLYLLVGITEEECQMLRDFGYLVSTRNIQREEFKKA